jgi:hypothetical protein
MSDLPIASIVIGERRREDYGDLDALAASIEQYDLLHPIVIDEASNLVAGERRLEACKRLGWTNVPVRRLGDLTEAERREIELEENLRRKDLTPYEQAKVLNGLAATAAEVLRQSEFLPESGKKSGRGRPPKPDAGERIAERTGIPRQTIDAAQNHVATVDDYLPTTGQGWKQYHVLEAREHLERMPEPERVKAAKLIDQPGIPPKQAVAVLGNLAAMPEPERAHVLDLSESTDQRDRSLALTEAAKVPPMPDPRLPLLSDAIEALRKAGRLFPADPETPRLLEIAAELKSMSSAIREGARNGHRA